LGTLQPGQRVLMLGDGEGRNAVWAARRHRVEVVELSSAGCELARSAAAAAGVQITLHCADLVRWLEVDERHRDLVCMTYVALPPRLESFVGQRIRSILTPCGRFIAEFAERVLQPGAIERIAPYAQVSIGRSQRDGLSRLHLVARS
jgi:cyclopropane fatty-acyl-phospholipid synthase-like methyltransferase